MHFKQKRGLKIIKKFWWILLVPVFLVIGLGIFIKVDAADAAEITDNYLRPIFGAKTIVWLEKVFYNFSDNVERLTYNNKIASDPQFEDQGLQFSSINIKTRLDLKTIPVDKNLTPVNNEGAWKNKPISLFPDEEVAAYTFVRPDPARPFAVVSVVQIDMKALRLGLVAGTKEPGGAVGKPGPGSIPKDIIESGKLVAAFDGGFQYRDGEYGMIVDNVSYLPLKNDTGTLVGFKNGTLRIVNYTGQEIGSDMIFVRQNCPILIENGSMAVLDSRNKNLWGRTLTSDTYTWRSGLGLNKNGNLLFAVGNNLTPATLAKALKMAGAQDAIQLDINPYWVRFNFFDSIGNGRYKSTTLNKSLQDGSKQYLSKYNKDFFYLYKK